MRVGNEVKIASIGSNLIVDRRDLEYNPRASYSGPIAMNKTTKISLAVGIALFLGYVIYSSMSLDQFRFEVCMEFQGRTACATAAGASAEEAQRTAKDTACAQISSGVTDSIACSNSTPKRVTAK